MIRLNKKERTNYTTYFKKFVENELKDKLVLVQKKFKFMKFFGNNYVLSENPLSAWDSTYFYTKIN